MSVISVEEAPMGDYGVAITFGDPHPGREQKALDLFMESVTANEKAVADGRMEKWDAIMFEPTGHPPAGAIRFYGSRQQIEDLLEAEDIQSIMMRASLYLTNFGYRRFTTGDALAQGMSGFGAAVASL
jgi:hypothetical protein